jgi:tRNA dimethylallyltransferase
MAAKDPSAAQRALLGQAPTLIVIGGPTASGKTHVAASLAKQLNTEVISADSRQFYHVMRIGTARPDVPDLLGVKHHFLGHLDLDVTWSAGEFARHAEPVLQDLLDRHGIAVLVGGSGLYIDALCNGLDPLPASDPAIRERLQQQLEREGLGTLVTELERLDPAHAAVIDRNNPHRVVRALEICLLTGQPFSEQRTAATQRTDMRIVRIAMDMPRAELYARIDERVDRMVADGLVEEVRSLLPYRHLNALNTVGYKELFAHFDGTYTLPEAIALIKQHTRNYAKRQLTWLRRDQSWQYLPPNVDAVIAHVDAQR